MSHHLRVSSSRCTPFAELFSCQRTSYMSNCTVDQSDFLLPSGASIGSLEPCCTGAHVVLLARLLVCYAATSLICSSTRCLRALYTTYHPTISALSLHFGAETKILLFVRTTTCVYTSSCIIHLAFCCLTLTVAKLQESPLIIIESKIQNSEVSLPHSNRVVRN